MPTYRAIREDAISEQGERRIPAVAWLWDGQNLPQVVAAPGYEDRIETYEYSMDDATARGFSPKAIWAYWQQHSGNGYDTLRAAEEIIDATDLQDAAEHVLLTGPKAKVFYEPGQRRYPEGSALGGQFAPQGGSGGSGGESAHTGSSRASAASGSSVSEKLSPKAPSTSYEKKTAAEIDHAIKIIDSVHGDGNLPKIPVQFDGSTTTHGVYKYSKVNGKRVAGHISISTRSTHTASTAVHEIGHFLDQQGLGGGDQFASSAKHPDLAGFDAAVGGSAAFKKLSAMHHDPKMPKQYRDHLTYLTGRSEIFARAYSQYIATKSGDPKLMAELNESLAKKSKVDPAKYMPMQWDHDDFAPIHKAMDDIFAKKGWLK